MANNYHEDLVNDSQLHVAKGFSGGSLGSLNTKDERGLTKYETSAYLPPALALAISTSPPPTEVDQAIYLIGANGAPHASWDGLAQNTWARFNFADDKWYGILPTEGYLCYDKGGNGLRRFDGSAWTFAAAASAGQSRVSAADATDGYLDDEIVGSEEIEKEIINPAANEQLKIKVKRVPHPIRHTLITGDNIVLGVNERLVIFGDFDVNNGSIDASASGSEVYVITGTHRAIAVFDDNLILTEVPIIVSPLGIPNIPAFAVDPPSAVDNDIWFLQSGGITQLRRRVGGVNKGVELS